MQVALEINGKRFSIDPEVMQHISSLKSQITQLQRELSIRTPVPVEPVIARAVPPATGPTVRPFAGTGKR